MENRGSFCTVSLIDICVLLGVGNMLRNRLLVLMLRIVVRARAHAHSIYNIIHNDTHGTNSVDSFAALHTETHTRSQYRTFLQFENTIPSAVVFMHNSQFSLLWIRLPNHKKFHSVSFSLWYKSICLFCVYILGSIYTYFGHSFNSSLHGGCVFCLCASFDLNRA